MGLKCWLATNMYLSVTLGSAFTMVLRVRATRMPVSFSNSQLMVMVYLFIGWVGSSGETVSVHLTIAVFDLSLLFLIILLAKNNKKGRLLLFLKIVLSLILLHLYPFPAAAISRHTPPFPMRDAPAAWLPIVYVFRLEREYYAVV